MAQWIQSQSTAEQRQINQFDGGVNNGTPPIYITDSQTSDETGSDTFEFPAFSTAKGTAVYGAQGSGNTNLLANYQNAYIVRSCGSTVQYDNAGIWTNMGTGLTDAQWDSTNFNNKLILTNQTDNVKYWDGTTFGDLNANAPKGKYTSNDTMRVFIANTAANKDWVYYSGFDDETDWTSVSYGFFEYYTPNGGEITGLYLWGNAVLVFKQDSFAEILGTGSDTNRYRLVPVSDQVGTVSYKTVQEIRGSLLWLGLNDVWLFSGGQPTPIGQNVKKFLDNINPDYYEKCWAVTDGQRYYLGIVTGANTSPDTLLCYDTKYQRWKVVNQALNGLVCGVAIGNKQYAGDTSGNTYRLNTGYASTWSLTSKVFDEGAPEYEKEYFEMHVQAYLPTGSTMTLSVSTDDRGDSFTTIDSFTAGSVALNQNFIIPLDIVPLCNFFRYKLSGTGQATIYKVERRFRVHPYQN